MSPDAIDQAIVAAIRRAAAAPALTGEGWTVRILTPMADRQVRLTCQNQVARLTLALERLGLVLQVDQPDEADFVFELCEMTAATG